MTFLLDTSVLTRLRVDAVRQRVAALETDGLRCCSITLLEVGFSARTTWQWDQLVGAVRVFDTVELTETHLGEAARTQRRLAAAGLRGRKVPDLIIAAVARLDDLTVLHYDKDFEHIAEVTAQPHEWVVPAGSID